MLKAFAIFYLFLFVCASLLSLYTTLWKRKQVVYLTLLIFNQYFLTSGWVASHSIIQVKFSSPWPQWLDKNRSFQFTHLYGLGNNVPLFVFASICPLFPGQCSDLPTIWQLYLKIKYLSAHRSCNKFSHLCARCTQHILKVHYFLYRVKQGWLHERGGGEEEERRVKESRFR